MYAVGGTSIDITQEIILNRHIREQEERLRNITNNIPNGIALQLEYQTRTQRFSIPYVSAGAEKILGKKASELQEDTQAFFELIHPEDLPSVKAALELSQSRMKAFDSEFRIVSRKDSYRWIQLKAMPRKKDGGLIWDGICMDVTESKKTETRPASQ